MLAIASTLDRHGQTIRVGDQVQILAVTPDPDMDEDDLDMIQNMVGSTCHVERIDDAGLAWVAVWWNCFEGPAITSVALAPAQMERRSD